MCVCALLAAAGLVVWSPGVGAHAAPRDAGCASLGDAARYVVFTDGIFNATESGGAQITGSVAAGGDVTLDGVTVNGSVVTGGNFSGGVTTHHGGTVTGSVQYAGTITTSAFTINGGSSRVNPPAVDFSSNFTGLSTLSASLADLDQTAGATVSLNPYSQELDLTGTGPGLNVFTVTSAQLTEAHGYAIDLTQPGATALINVTTDTILTLGPNYPQYMNLSGAATPSGVVWNFPLATAINVTRGIGWKGLILAPNAAVSGSNEPQLTGQLIAASVPGGTWTFNNAPSTVCLPPPPPPTPPDDSLQLSALCVDANGNLDMRLRNTGNATRTGNWIDLHGTDFGTFAVPAASDLFFVVHNPTATSEIEATSGATTVSAAGTTAPCQGQITVEKVAAGDAPAGQTWVIRVTGGATGNESTALTLGAGESQTVTVPGGYQSGVAAIDQVVGGIPYTISEDDPHGATTTISLNPVVILDGQHELVVVTNTYAAGGGGGGGVSPENPGPVDPTLPPGAPEPPPGPNLVGGPGADLAITHSVTPKRLVVDGIVTTVTRVRNLGPKTAVGVVAREIPQFRPNAANSVADVLSLTSTQGTCTQRRPVRCALGTLAAGAVATIRTRTRVLVAATLRSVVVVSSDTPDPNTSNNLAQAGVTTLSATTIRARVIAPPSVPFGSRFVYRVSATVTGRAAATAVRLCTRPPSSLIGIRAPGTFVLHGSRCRNLGALRAGRSSGFALSVVPSRSGHLTLPAVATAVDAPRSRASAPVLVGPVAACRAISRRTRPVARAAC